jgi:hypothetical protein
MKSGYSWLRELGSALVTTILQRLSIALPMGTARASQALMAGDIGKSKSTRGASVEKACMTEVAPMTRGVQYVCYIDESGYYIGDAARIAEFLRSEPASLSSVWVPAHEDGNLTLIRTEDVQVLWDVLGQLGGQFRSLNRGMGMDQTVHMFMPCGCITRYTAFDDLPWKSEPCGCGDPTHWLIWYTRDRG